MNSDIGLLDGRRLDRMQQRVYNLDDPAQFAEFTKDETIMIEVPGTGRSVPYTRTKKTGVAVSRLGAPAAISTGAYIYAINHLNTIQ